MVSDNDIKRNVETELRWDPDIDVDDITGVTAKGGVVTLTGFVRSYSDKFEAETAAKRVTGVVGLANDLEVRLPGFDQRPDPDIAQDAVAMLKNWLPGRGRSHQGHRQGRLAHARGRGRMALSAGSGRERGAPSEGREGRRQSDPAEA